MRANLSLGPTPREKPFIGQVNLCISQYVQAIQTWVNAKPSFFSTLFCAWPACALWDRTLVPHDANWLAPTFRT